MGSPLVTGLSPVYFSGFNRQVMRFVLDKTSRKVRAEQAELSSGLALTDEKPEVELGQGANELDGVSFSPADGTKWLVYDEQGQAHQFKLDNRGILHESLAGRYAPMKRRYEPGKNLWVAESGKGGENVNLQKSALAHFPDRAEISQFFLDRKKSEEALQEAHKAWRAALKDFPENSFAQLPPEPKVPEFVADTLKGELELSLVNSGITPSQYPTPEAAYQDLWALRHQFFNLLARSGSEKDLMKVAGDLYHYSARTDLNSLFERKPFESDENFRDRCQAGRLDFILSCLDQSLSAIEQKFPNEIAKTKAKLETQGETSHSALDESLEGFIGKDGIYIKTVLDDTSISRDLKALYLKKAMTEEWPVFFESLDALYREAPSNIELISALKSIHDFCFNNDVGMGGDFGVRSQLAQYFERQVTLNLQIRKELMVAAKKMVEESIDSLLANSEEEKTESAFLEPKSSEGNPAWRSKEEFHLTQEQIEFSEPVISKEMKKIFSSGNLDRLIKLSASLPTMWGIFFKNLSVEEQEYLEFVLEKELKESFHSGNFFRILELYKIDPVGWISQVIERSNLSLIFQFMENSNYSSEELFPIFMDEYFSKNLIGYLIKFPLEKLEDIFPKLLRHRLLDGQGDDGSTLFHSMAKNSRWDDIIALLEKNDISQELLDIQNDDGFTLLHFAVLAGNDKAVSMLIEAGVNLNLRLASNPILPGFSKKTTLDLALQLGHLNIAYKLKAAGGVPTTPEGLNFVFIAEAEKFFYELPPEKRSFDNIKEFFHLQYHSEYLSKHRSERDKSIKLISLFLASGDKDAGQKFWRFYEFKKITLNDDDKEENILLMKDVPSILVAMKDYRPIHPEALRVLIETLKSKETLNVNERDEIGNTALDYCLTLQVDFFKGSFKVLSEAGAEFYPNFSQVERYLKSINWQDSDNISEHLAREFVNHHPKIEDLDEKTVEEGVRQFFKVLSGSPAGEQYRDRIQAAVMKMTAEKKNDKKEVPSSTWTWLYSSFTKAFSSGAPLEEKNSKGPGPN